jgi:hypothetical protein
MNPDEVRELEQRMNAFAREYGQTHKTASVMGIWSHAWNADRV